MRTEANERNQACHPDERYRLHFVFDCVTPSPQLLHVRNPFAKLLATRQRCLCFLLRRGAQDGGAGSATVADRGTEAAA